MGHGSRKMTHFHLWSVILCLLLPYELFKAKTRVLGLFDGEDFVILSCVVLTQCQRVTVTDRQTDRRTTPPYLIQGSA